MKRFVTLGGAVVVFAVVLRALAGNGVVSGEGIKGYLIPFVELYLNTFNSQNTALALCGAMVVVALCLMVYYWRFRIGSVASDLRRFAASLDGVDEAPASEAALRGIDEAVESHRRFAEPWTLFRATLDRGDEGRITAPFAPSRYFDLKALQRSGLRLRMFLGLPNDFVGVGLIFTFLGLVAGLYFASKSMMSADLQAARDSLELLLHAATFKFLTSITGIGLSLMLSWSQRSLMDSLQDALSDVQFQIERLLPVGTGRGVPRAAGQAPEKVALRTVP